MKKRMKQLTAFMLAGIMVFSMIGCGPKKEKEDPAESSEKEVLRVLNWGSTEEEKIADDAIARFNEDYPNVEVKQTCVPVDSWSDFIQKWITMSTSGEAPDVINLGLEAVQMAVSNDLLEPLDDIVANDDSLTELKGEYAEALLEGFNVDSHLYGLPSGDYGNVL